MAQNYYFSPTTTGFYPVSLKEAYMDAGSFPPDAALIDDNLFSTYSKNPPSGMKRGANDGVPAWIPAA